VYSTMLLKSATQKEKMDWNSLTTSSRLHVAPIAVPVIIDFRDITFVIIILYL
jgi:hypothetical protein